MKLRESLFAKLSAVALVLVLSVLVGCGAYFSANLFTRREVYKDSYVETGACERQMEDSAYDVSEYFSLTLLSQKQELTYEQQTELDTLRESIGPETKGNFVWQIMDGSGTVLLSNIEDDGAALSQLTNGDYRHQSFGLKDTVLGTDGSTTTTTTRYRIQYGLRDKLPYKDAYSKASSEFQYSKRWLTPVIILSGAGLIAVLLLYGLPGRRGRAEGGRGPDRAESFRQDLDRDSGCALLRPGLYGRLFCRGGQRMAAVRHRAARHMGRHLRPLPDPPRQSRHAL